MAISKRLRFEILRRDNHTCQYCGEKAPDVTLHVDHVKPRTLGGNDSPENLVTACKDCNSGKTSSSLDAPLVAAIAQRNLDWEIRAAELSAKMRGTIDRDRLYCDDLEHHWNTWAVKLGRDIELPFGWQSSAFTWAGMGVPMESIELAIDVAMGAKRPSDENRFQYFAGVLWNQIKAHEIGLEAPEEVRTFTEDENIEAWQMGYSSGQVKGQEQTLEQVPTLQARFDPLSLVVDGMTTDYINKARWER